MRSIAALLLLFVFYAPASAQDTATVVFLRPLTGTTLMDASRSVVLKIREADQEPQMVGIGGGGTRIAYRAAPGPHTFMVVGENTEFLDANLLPNTTYYVLVPYRSGRFRGQYSFKPVDAQEQNSAEFKSSLAKAKLVENDAASETWLKSNLPSVKRRIQDGYGPWVQKPAAEKTRLGNPPQ